MLAAKRVEQRAKYCVIFWLTANLWNPVIAGRYGYSSGRREKRERSSRRLLARYPTVLFFLLSFVLTWGYFWLIFAPLHLPDSLRALGVSGQPSQRSSC